MTLTHSVLLATLHAVAADVSQLSPDVMVYATATTGLMNGGVLVSQFGLAATELFIF